MRRTSDLIGVVLISLQIPLAVACGLQILDVSTRAEWIRTPSIFASFALAAGVLLVVALLERKQVLWMRPSFRWFAMLFSIGVWLLLSYALKTPVILLVLLGYLPTVLRKRSS